MPRQLREVVFVDGVRTPFGKAKGQYAETRADDLVIKCIRELMRRNPGLPPERVDEVAIAATTQIGDQGLTIGRTAALLSGLPQSVPGYAIDRMCAGAMTAVTTTAGGIAFGSYDVAIAGGVEHMGRHPMGEGVDPNPRILSERIVNPDALVMGKTAENLHDRYPTITKERVDAYAVRSQAKTAAAYEAGVIQPDLVPVAPSREWVEELRGTLPENPVERRARLQEAWGFTDLEMRDVVAAGVVEAIEETVAEGAAPQAARKWWLSELSRRANDAGVEITELGVTPAQVAAVQKLVDDKVVNDKLARQVFDGLLAGEGTPAEIVEKRGLAVVSDDGALGAAVDAAIAANPDVAQKIRDGKVQAAGALIGAVMKEMRGQADAGRVRELILEKLA